MAAQKSSSKDNTKGKSNEIKIIRVYDSPVEDVWDAWTDPEQVAQWWGPRGFTITTHSKDLRPDGHWRYTMHGPDGTDWPNVTKYFEVEKHAKLVYDHGGSDDRPPLFRVTVLFSETNGKTTMDMTCAFATAEVAAEMGKFIKQAGGNSTWDRLAEYLAKQKGKETFVIARTFDCPIDEMFEMWTNPKHFSQWLPPTGFTMEFIKADIKPGGSTFWYMTDGGATKMYGRANYQEIARPNRLVYTQEFADETNTKTLRHPALPTWPATMLTTVTLTAEAPDRTRVLVVWEPSGATTKEEMQSFIEMRGSMTLGWTGSFDKLEELLAVPSA